MNNQQPTANSPVITLVPSKTANVLAVASFVCGIIGIVTIGFGFVPGFLGYALYLDAKRRGRSGGILTAALVLNIIAMVGSLALICLTLVCSGMVICSAASI